MNEEILRQTYISIQKEIKKDDIDAGLFEVLENRRNISAHQVNSILRSLEEGKHFDAPFVVNEVKGCNRLLDGNHRYEAMKIYLEKNPANKIEITIHSYDNLEESDERLLYTRYNQGKKQSTNDFVQQYKSTIKIWKIIQKDKLPIDVTVYPSKNSLGFYKLIGSYLAAIKPGSFVGDFGGKPLDFISEVQNLKKSDVVQIREFLKEFLLAFGPFRNNPWYSTTPFKAVFRIWMSNKHNMTPERMVYFFKQKLEKDYEAREMSKITGLSATRFARDKYLIKLNDGRSRNLFIGDKPL